LEKQITELGKVFEEGVELKPKKVGFFIKIGLIKTEEEKKKALEEKERKRRRKEEDKRINELEGRKKKEIKEKPLEKKEKVENKEKEKGSNLFVKCHILIDKSNKALNVGGGSKAKKLYSKVRKIYLKLEYEEKKNLHKDLVKLYDRLSK